MKHFFFGLCVSVVVCAINVQFSAVAIARSQETVLHSFAGPPDGFYPDAGLIDVKGTLYSTTQGGGTGTRCVFCGTVFSLDPGTGAETVVYSFCSRKNRKKLNECQDAQAPVASLIDVKGRLYGTAEYGGINGEGAVFRINPRSNQENLLYSFCSQQNCVDGERPGAALIDVNGTLYGTTTGGGTGTAPCGNSPAHCGTVFAVDPNTGTETAIYSFGSSATDGYMPEGGLINVNGMLYGTTLGGGTHDAGTVFALNPSTGAETVLYSFCSQQNCADGEDPEDSLIDVNGTLYGTTPLGGNTSSRGCRFWGCGTVFALDPDSGTETVVYPFCSRTRHHKVCRDGQMPEAGLIEVKGMLYGTTSEGGGNPCPGNRRCGTVFSIDPNSGVEKVLYSFCGQQNCADGENPKSDLIDVKGTLYSTTVYGGAYGEGTVFAVRR
ncbi:MAG TPA: choice-of-anchor tandem repeat GloVer-containing protein [Rhizomicrobium sp.]|nr:choice-of-anchor tandem repeat GloVer-containing protein [Rhizomicrobium sp.]